MLNCKTVPLCVIIDQPLQPVAFDLEYIAAFVAEQKDADVVMVRMSARDIGVAAFDSGGNALLAKEVQRPVDARRGDRPAQFCFQNITDVIGAQRPPRRQERSERLPPQGGHLRPFQLAGCDRSFKAKRALDVLVLVSGCAGHGFHLANSSRRL